MNINQVSSVVSPSTRKFKHLLILFSIITISFSLSLAFIACTNPAGGSDDGSDAGPTVPGEVIDFQATAGNEYVVLTWEAPLNNGGADITSYTVSGDDGVTWKTADSDTEHTFTDLEIGTEYTFKVRAQNAAGSGPVSTQKATPAPVPGVVSNFNVHASLGTAYLSWGPPLNIGGGPILGYLISNDNGASWEDYPSPWIGSWSFIDLENGTEYTFKVRAYNEYGPGSISTIKKTPLFLVPEAVSYLTATPGNTEVALSWEAPGFDGGAPIILYEVSSDAGESWVEADSDTGHTFTDLTNGTVYTFLVRAVNLVGPGGPSVLQSTPYTIPGTVSNFTVHLSGTMAMLTWSDPLDDGGSAVTRYEVSRGEGWISSSPPFSYYISTYYNFSVRRQTQYTFSVRAINAAGEGPETSLELYVPDAAPPQVSNFTTTPGSELVVLSWSAPSNDGSSPVTRYEVSIGNANWLNMADNTGHTFTGLNNGTQYTFRVRAVNVLGPGTITTQTATPRTVPDAVTNFAISPGSSSATLSWGAPLFNGGAPVTAYEVSSDDGTTWIAATNNASHTFTGLNAELEYTFKVRAVNAAGAGQETEMSAYPRILPQAVRNFTAAPDNTQVVLSWDAPLDSGGLPIIRYEVNSGGDWLNADSNNSHTFAGLANGTQYTFQVRAVTVVGPGTEAAQTATQRTIPDAVTNITSSLDNGQVALSWTVPANDGGSPITGYQISSDNGLTWVNINQPVLIIDMYSAAGGWGNDQLTVFISGQRRDVRLYNGSFIQNTLAINVGDTINVYYSANPAYGLGNQAFVIYYEDAPPIPAFNPNYISGSPSTVWNGSNALLFRQYRTLGEQNIGQLLGSFTVPGHTFSGLVNNTQYTFSIRAVNAAGPGPENTHTTTPGIIPGVVRNLARTQVQGQVVISWDDPLDNGGGPIIRYEVSSNGGSTWVTANGSNSHAFSGFTNNTRYSLSVRAVNSIGPGDVQDMPTFRHIYPANHMVLIPAGTFTMGSPTGEEGRQSNEGTQRQVTLSAFYMGIFQVTQGLYTEVMGSNPSYHLEWISGEDPDRRPVDRVSWYDALVFANRLSILEGLNPAYRINNSTDPDDWGPVPTAANYYDSTWNAVEIVPNSTGYRLPTEAQWEYACRAGTTGPYHTNGAIGNVAWHRDNSWNFLNLVTHEAGLKEPNAWGLHDMHGNVDEWCWDFYGSYSGQAQTDPMGPSTGNVYFERISRGGSYAYTIGSGYLRSARRSGISPDSSGNTRGFRLVRPAE